METANIVASLKAVRNEYLDTVTYYRTDDVQGVFQTARRCPGDDARNYASTPGESDITAKFVSNATVRLKEHFGARDRLGDCRLQVMMDANNLASDKLLAGAYPMIQWVSTFVIAMFGRLTLEPHCVTPGAVISSQGRPLSSPDAC